MRWYIDGYNVTKSDPATKGLSLEDQRAALEARCRIKAQAVLGTHDYRIIWDGSGGFSRNGTAGASSKEHYTRMPTADDSIVNLVAQSRTKCGVVSNDRRLIERCKGVATCGVEIKPSDVLYEARAAKAKHKQAPKMNRNVGIPANAHAINEELKKLWGIE